MRPNMAKLPLEDMTREQFRNWLLPIVKHSLFVEREQLLVLLSADTDRVTLTEAFRGLFEGYYYDVASALDCYEECLLSILNSCDVYVSLKYRVAIVEGKREASPMGREVRRMGSFLPTDPVPRIKVSALPDDDFLEFLHTLVKSEFFAAQERVVKLLNTTWAGDTKPPKREAANAENSRLREVVYEFFVCHLELEQFLENYEYDPDEGLEINPEVTEALEQSIADHESGKVRGRPAQDVAKAFGITLKCTH